MPKVADTPAPAQPKRRAEAQTVAMVTRSRSRSAGAGAPAATRKKKRTTSPRETGVNLIFSPENGLPSDEEFTQDDKLEDEEEDECKDLESSTEDEEDEDEDEENELTAEDEQEHEKRKEHKNLVVGLLKCPAGQRSIAIGRSKSGKSNRIKKNDKEAKAKAKAKAKADAKKKKANRGRHGRGINLSKNWENVHARTRTALSRKRCGLYVIRIADGLYKWGFIYNEGELSKQNLGRRVNNVTQGVEGGVDVRFIDTGDLTKEAVMRIELLAKFASFVKTTMDDGVELSHYSGRGELYKLDDSFVDELLSKLLEYAKSNIFHLDVGNGVPHITGESIGKKGHEKWLQFAYKTGRAAHRHPRCKWTGGDTEGEGEDYWQEWIGFARTDCTCPCITKSTANKKKKKKKKKKKNTQK